MSAPPLSSVRRPRSRSSSLSLSIARSPSVLSSGLFLSQTPQTSSVAGVLANSLDPESQTQPHFDVLSQAQSQSHSQSHTPVYPGYAGLPLTNGLDDPNSHPQSYSHHPYAHTHARTSSSHGHGQPYNNPMRRVVSASAAGAQSGLDPISSVDELDGADEADDLTGTTRPNSIGRVNNSAPHLPGGHDEVVLELDEPLPPKKDSSTRTSRRSTLGDGTYTPDTADTSSDAELEMDAHVDQPLLPHAPTQHGRHLSKGKSRTVTFQSPSLSFPPSPSPSPSSYASNRHSGSPTNASLSTSWGTGGGSGTRQNADYELNLDYDGPFQPPDSKELMGIILSCVGVLVLAVAAGMTTIFDWVL